MAITSTADAISLSRLLLDKAQSPYYTDAEITSFLELAIKEFINENYKKFEVTQGTRDSLRTLVKSSTTLTLNNLNEYTLPNDYRHLLSFEVTTPQGAQAVKFIQLDDFLALKNDPFNKATDKNVLGIFENNLIKVFSLSTLYPSHKLTYLAWDETNDDITSLPAHTREDIVNITVRKLMGSVKDDAYKIQIGEEQKNKI